jgi:hypothetical protein
VRSNDGEGMRGAGGGKGVEIGGGLGVCRGRGEYRRASGADSAAERGGYVESGGKPGDGYERMAGDGNEVGRQHEGEEAREGGDGDWDE